MIIEDSVDDTILLVRHIKKAGFEIEYKRIEEIQDLKKSLKKSFWDIIIADYVLPKCTGIDILKICQNMAPNIPFILVSGNVSEEVAVKAMNLGAHDCIMKDNLTRLIPVIKRELNRPKYLYIDETDRMILDAILKYREIFIHKISKNIEKDIRDLTLENVQQRIQVYFDFIDVLRHTSSSKVYLMHS